MIRYLAALITATLAGVAGIWLVLAPAALGYPGGGYASVPSRVSLGTGAGLCLVAVVTVVCWSVAWRRRLRADGVLPRRGPAAEVPLEEATTGPLTPVRPDDADLHALLAPLIAAMSETPGEPGAAGSPAPGSGGARGEAGDAPAVSDRAPARTGEAGAPARAASGGAPARTGEAASPEPAAVTPVPAPYSGGDGAGTGLATPFGAARETRPPLPRRRAARYADDDAEETW